MHDERRWAEQTGTLGGEAEGCRVLAEGGKELLVHALALETQEVDHIGFGHNRIDVVAHLDRPALQRRRQQRRRRHQGHGGTEGRKGDHIGAGNPAVPDVADDRDTQP